MGWLSGTAQSTSVPSSQHLGLLWAVLTVMNQGEPTWPQSTIAWLQPLSTKSSQMASGITWCRKAYIWNNNKDMSQYFLRLSLTLNTWQVCFYFVLACDYVKWPSRTQFSLLLDKIQVDVKRYSKIVYFSLKVSPSQGQPVFLFCFVLFLVFHSFVFIQTWAISFYIWEKITEQLTKALNVLLL